MANVDSYPKHDAKYVLMEHDRTAKHYKNNVDKERTPLNWSYGMCVNVDDVMQAINDRCEAIMCGRKIQNQTNIMCDWVVTYPAIHCTEKEYVNKDGKKIKYNSPNDDEHCEKFFDEVYRFACNRYGAENVIVGYVHMDETTPHIDICFVPETISRKNKKRTVSSASLLTKSELKAFHYELEKHMVDVFDEDNMILNGRTKGNYSVSELKARQQEELEMNEERENLKQQEELLLQQQVAIKKQQEVLNRQIAKYKRSQKELNEQIKENERLIELGRVKQEELDKRKRVANTKAYNINANRQNSTSYQFGR